MSEKTCQFKAMLASDKRDEHNMILSQKALMDMATSAESYPVSRNFDDNEIGRAWVDVYRDGALFVEGRVDAEVALTLDGELYAVPAFRYEQGTECIVDGVMVLDKVELFAIAITATPADPHLSPIRWDQ